MHPSLPSPASPGYLIFSPRGTHVLDYGGDDEIVRLGDACKASARREELSRRQAVRTEELLVDAASAAAGLLELTQIIGDMKDPKKAEASRAAARAAAEAQAAARAAAAAREAVDISDAQAVGGGVEAAEAAAAAAAAKAEAAAKAAAAPPARREVVMPESAPKALEQLLERLSSVLSDSGIDFSKAPDAAVALPMLPVPSGADALPGGGYGDLRAGAEEGVQAEGGSSPAMSARSGTSSVSTLRNERRSLMPSGAPNLGGGGGRRGDGAA